MDRAKLWTALIDELAVPHDLVKIIKNLYVDSRGVLQKGATSSDDIAFPTAKGVK